MHEINKAPITPSISTLKNATDDYADTDDEVSESTFSILFLAENDDINSPTRTPTPSTELQPNALLTRQDENLEIGPNGPNLYQQNTEEESDQPPIGLTFHEALGLPEIDILKEHPPATSEIEKYANGINKIQELNIPLGGVSKGSDIAFPVAHHFPKKQLNSTFLQERPEITSGDLKTMEVVKPIPSVISDASDIRRFINFNQPSSHQPKADPTTIDKLTSLKPGEINPSGLRTTKTELATAQQVTRLQVTQFDHQTGRIEALPNAIHAPSENPNLSRNVADKSTQPVQGSSLPDTPITTLKSLKSKQRETLDLPLSSDMNTKQTSQLQQVKTSLQTPHGASDPRQIAQQLAVNFSKQQDGTMVVRLNPDELGQVRMTLKSVDGVMTMTILAERPETTEAMRRNINDLAQEFENLGYEGLDFSFSDESTSPHQEADHEMDEFNIDSLQIDQPILETATTISTSTGRLDIRL